LQEEMTMFRSSIVFAVTLASISILSQVAEAQQSETKLPPESLGNLTCSFGEDVERETTAGRAQSIVCVFHATAGGTEELYVGTAYSSGPAAGSAGNISLSWIVKGPADAIGEAGGLEQVYTAQGVGDVENSAPLVGKEDDVIALHPVALPAAGASNNTAQARKIAVIELKLKTTVA
jgi:hypothetical protein